ncbi:MAG: hypothetical protein Kow00109_18360 [Acidobacteriota bacterium]
MAKPQDRVKRVTFLFTTVAVLLAGLSGAAQSDWFPFVPPWDDTAPTVVDASGLLLDHPGQDPADVIDRRGPVVVGPDGHFYFSKTGKRALFWGVNFTFSANFPPHDLAEKVAARLAKLGVNVVRFHHMDYFGEDDRNPGIWAVPDFPYSTQRLSPTQLDRWDYLVYQLKRHGIYVNVNLKVARHFGPGDGLEDTHLFTDNYFFRGVSHWNERMIELQQDYARQLLDRVNPYTGLKYTEDPVVFCVEIANEDSLFGSLLTDGEINYIPGRSGVLPERYSREFDAMWNQWLRDRYGDEATLRAAWDPGVPAPDPTNRVRNGDFSSWDSSNRPQDWFAQGLNGAQVSWAVEPAAGPDGGAALRLQILRSTGVNWHVQLIQSGHAVEQGQRYEVTFYARADRNCTVTLDVMENRDPWRNYGLSKGFDLTTSWAQYRASFVANTTDPEYARITFELGEAPTGTRIWIDKVEFRETAPVVLDPGESLAAGTIQRPLRSDFGRYSDARIRDLLRFYYEVDYAYFTGMRRFLKEDLGLQAVVTGTAPWWAFLGDSAVQSQLDFVDGHYYWDHPWWPNVPAWSPTGWVISNNPQVNTFDRLSRLAFQAVAGKPFTVSEYNQPFPNRYAAEAPLLIAAFGALQDWDAVYMFDYAGSFTAFDDSYTTSFFSLCGNPIKTAQMPVAARIFLGRQLEPARGLLTLDLDLETLFTAYAQGLVAGDDYLASRGFDRANTLVHRVRTRSFAGPEGNLQRPLGATTVTSDHGQLTWDRRDPDRTFVRLDAPAVAGAVGFLGGQELDFGWWGFSSAADSPDHFGVILQSAGGKPLRESARLLLSVWSEHQNTGMIWNEAGNSVDNRWGGPPPIVRPVRLRLRFAPPEATGVRLFALDATGARREELALTHSGGAWEVLLDTGATQTVWFELTVNEPSAEVPYTILPESLTERYSQGEGETFRLGWAEIVPESGDDPAWTPLLEYSLGGILTSMVRVPAVAPAAQWYFPVRQKLPDLRCALALVNPEEVAAEVQIRVFGAEGNVLQQGALVLQAGERHQFFLDEWLPGGDASPLPAEFAGTIAVSAPQPIAVQVLRAAINRRGEYFLTPVSGSLPGTADSPLYLPQLGAGPGYSTEFLLFNPWNTGLLLEPEFFSPDGTPAPRPTGWPALLELPLGATRHLTLPRGDTEFYGYLRLRTAGNLWPYLSVVMSRWEGENLVSEVEIPALAAATEIRLPVLERPLQWTAVALLNPSETEELELEITVEGAAGTGLDPAVVTLGPGERRSFFLRELYPALAGYASTPCVVRADRPFGLLALLGNFNQRNEFLLTAVLDDGRRDGPARRRIIPTILDGAGYRMLLYAAEPHGGGGRIVFRDDRGQPLPLLMR